MEPLVRISQGDVEHAKGGGSYGFDHGSRPRNRVSSPPPGTDDALMAPRRNTDTKRYWNLTRNIYRFGYLLASEAGGIHTVDEHIKADALVEAVRFMQRLIVNADEYDGN